MGDLKKKTHIYEIKSSNDDAIMIEEEQIAIDDEVIGRLKSYMEKFYEMQLSKMKKEEAEEDGKI